MAFYDIKSYDRDYFGESGHEIEFFECRLSRATVPLASGFGAVCIFVNDVADRACLDSLAESGVQQIALRCAGFNNVDLEAAEELGIAGPVLFVACGGRAYRGLIVDAEPRDSSRISTGARA